MALLRLYTKRPMPVSTQMTKIKLLFCCFLGALSACNNSPQEAAKSQRKERAVIVETTQAQRADVSHRIERNGTLRAHRRARLSLQQEGLLLALPFHEGDRVQKGELLAQLDDTLLRAQLKKSTAQRRQAELDLKRLKRLQSKRVVAEEEISRAATALDVARAEEEELRIRLQQSHLLAPFDGIISERLAEPGDTLPRFSHVLTLIDTQSLTTELQLSELVISALQVGDEVELTIDALGSQPLSGTIERIHPALDADSHQGTIEVRLNSTPHGAQPGQLCRVSLQLRRRARLLVPYNALRRDTRGEFLFVVNADNRVERRAITSGQHFGEKVEVLDGLNSSERIVTRGFLGLSAGALTRQATNGKQP